MVLRKNATHSGYMGRHHNRVESHDCVLTRRQTQNHQSERDTQILLSLSLSWLCVQRCVKTQTWDATLRIASYECVLTQRWTQSHESERDSTICASLSLTCFCVWCCVKTQSSVMGRHPQERVETTEESRFWLVGPTGIRKSSVARDF